MTYKVTAEFDDDDFVDFRRLAHLDRRSPREQIRIVLERYVKRSRRRLYRDQPRALRPLDHVTARRQDGRT
jgi:hypothetical protein